LNKITDLKSAPKGVNPKIYILKRKILKKFSAGGKAKLAYFTGEKRHIYPKKQN
jgi:hypothetical protein